MSDPLVSIIIPCYNAERWVGEAIASSLAQTYRPIEVIVVDDGSTDCSLRVIRSFGDQIIWETGPNRGGNHARNRGYARSKGAFVQFLDADDYLFPEKIERQAAYFASGGVELVFSDWQYKFHLPSGIVKTRDVYAATDDELLDALLSQWWVAPSAVLCSRELVHRVGGWDESLRAGQDTDFMFSAALCNAKAVYCPGVHSGYRRYLGSTVSTGNPGLWAHSHIRVLDKVCAVLRERGSISRQRRLWIASYYHSKARCFFERDKEVYNIVVRVAQSYAKRFPGEGSMVYRQTCRMFGPRMADRLAAVKRRLVGVRRPLTIFPGD